MSKSEKLYTKLFENWQIWKKNQIEELVYLKNQVVRITNRLKISTDKDALSENEEKKARKELKMFAQKYVKLLNQENPHWILFRNAFKTQLEAFR